MSGNGTPEASELVYVPEASWLPAIAALGLLGVLAGLFVFAVRVESFGTHPLQRTVLAGWSRPGRCCRVLEHRFHPSPELTWRCPYRQSQT